MKYDVIIVGARCAGAALAYFLVKNNLKVLVLDAAKKATDMTLSTHFIQSPGMKILDEIGIGQALRKIAPATKNVLGIIGDVEIYSDFESESYPHCIRRIHLDTALQQAADEAGAEFWDQAKVTDLMFEASKVVGVKVRVGGEHLALRSDLVVGADGPTSVVAKRTDSQAYIQDTLSLPAHWAYIRTPKIWREGVLANIDMLVEWQACGYRSVFQTDGDLLLITASSHTTLTPDWTDQSDNSMLSYCMKSERLAPLVKSAEITGRVRTIKKANFYLRKPVGQGYVLLGDAGCRKHFVSGQGISEALIEAKNISSVIIENTKKAYKKYWNGRDARVLPLYFDAILQSDLKLMNSRLMNRLLSELSQDKILANRLGLCCSRKILPIEIFPASVLRKVFCSILIERDVTAVKDIWQYVQRAVLPNGLKVSKGYFQRSLPGF